MADTYTADNGQQVSNNNGVISATGLANPTTPVTLPKTPVPTYVPPPITPIPENTDSAGLQQWLTANSTPPPSTQDIYNADVSNADLTGKQDAVNTATNAVTQEQANLSAINSQLKGISDNTTQEQLKSTGEGLSMPGYNARSLDTQRQNAIAAIPLQAQALASQAKIQSLQGNETAAQNLLTQAQAQVDKLFQIQSTDATNQYNYQQSLIKSVYDYATKEQQAQLDAKKASDAQIYQIATNNLNNAQSVANGLMATDPALAAKISAIDWYNDPNAMSKFTALQAKAAPTKPIGTDNSGGASIGTVGSPTINANATGYTTNDVGGTGLTQAAIDQAAMQYALTGVMPSIGLGSTGQAANKRNAIQNRAGELNAGGNIQANKAVLQANQASLKTQTEYLNTVQRSLANADNGLKQILDVYTNAGLNPTSSTIANKWISDYKTKISGGDQFALQAALQEVANEYQQVFSRGGQVSDTVRNQASKIINENVSLTDLKKIGDELQAQGKIVVGGTQSQINSIANIINGIVGGGTSTQSSGSNDPLGIR
jgi:hypothetical protein